MLLVPVGAQSLPPITYDIVYISRVHPNTGNGADFDCSRSFTNCPNVGVFNTGPALLPDGRVDFPAPCRVGDPEYPPVPCQGGNNTRVEKFTLPSGAPSNELLVVYTRGAANHNGIYVGAGLTQPFYDGGIYRMRGDQTLSRPEDYNMELLTELRRQNSECPTPSHQLQV
ncbi:MAG TPA: hypothetical protein VI837_00870 [Blastocatellia bacterium]|nr:hypothetical protein [Blastocatellia bacterium]